jgi:hypothetical protein
MMCLIMDFLDGDGVFYIFLCEKSSDVRCGILGGQVIHPFIPICQLKI